MNVTFYKLKKLPILFIALVVLFSSSCRVQLLPDYSAELSKQVDNTAKMVDEFYISMREKSKVLANQRAYNNYVDQYVEIEVELNSLLIKNRVRPLNQNTVRICEIALQLWNKYRDEHKKDNTLSDGLIRLNQKSMSDFFYAMQVAEQAKKIINSTPR